MKKAVKKTIAKEGLIIFIIAIICVAEAILEPIYIKHRYNKYPEIKITLNKLGSFYSTARFKKLPFDVKYDKFYNLHEFLESGYTSSNKAFFDNIHDYLDGRRTVMPDFSVNNLDIKPMPHVGPPVILSYLFYLLIRFIIWTIKAVKKK